MLIRLTANMSFYRFMTIRFSFRSMQRIHGQPSYLILSLRVCPHFLSYNFPDCSSETKRIQWLVVFSTHETAYKITPNNNIDVFYSRAGSLVTAVVN
ncbi:MAG: hypothetical protein H6Q65_75 [Firmicutes bacterium]|nr:hypothetical protein [Bacillota bacterium]